jgi:hypothetical protein
VPVIARKQKRSDTHILFDKNQRISDKCLEKIIPMESSIWYFAKKWQSRYNLNKTLYLVFDQFEELFSYPDEDIFMFKKQLSELLYRDVPINFRKVMEIKLKNNPNLLTEEEKEWILKPINVRVLFSIRDDRMSLMKKLSDFLPDILRITHELKPLKREQARLAIVQPASKTGTFNSEPFTYNNDSVEFILDFLSAKNTQPIETTQLQILCNRCESLAQNIYINTANPTTLTRENIPDFDNIFIDFYRDILKDIPENERLKTEKFIEEQLIKREQRVSLDRLSCLEFVAEKVLQQLLDYHLLRSEQNTTGGISFELAHDTLVAPILQVRHQRIEREEEENQLQIRNEELRIEREKAEKEKAEREKERKQQRRIIYIVSVAAMVSVAFGIFGYINMRKAQEQTELAVMKSQIANQKEKEAKDALEKLKLSEFNKLSEEANRLCKELKYAQAITILDSAFKWTNDSASLQNRKDSLLKIAGKEIKFEQLMKQAEELAKTEKTYMQAIEFYRQAVQIDYNNQLATSKMNALQTKFNNRLSFYKTKASEYIKKGDAFKANALNLFIRPGLEMNPGDAELLRLEKEAKQ